MTQGLELQEKVIECLQESLSTIAARNAELELLNAELLEAIEDIITSDYTGADGMPTGHGKTLAKLSLKARS